MSDDRQEPPAGRPRPTTRPAADRPERPCRDPAAGDRDQRPLARPGAPDGTAGYRRPRRGPGGPRCARPDPMTPPESGTSRNRVVGGGGCRSSGASWRCCSPACSGVRSGWRAPRRTTTGTIPGSTPSLPPTSAPGAPSTSAAPTSAAPTSESPSSPRHHGRAGRAAGATARRPAAGHRRRAVGSARPGLPGGVPPVGVCQPGHGGGHRAGGRHVGVDRRGGVADRLRRPSTPTGTTPTTPSPTVTSTS